MTTVAKARATESANLRYSEILDAALVLFARDGYESTTMNGIAAAVGLKGPSLYNHVGSKSELLVTLITRITDRLIEGQQAAIASSDDPVEQLRLAVESHVRYHARHRLDAEVSGRELRNLEPRARRRLVARRREYAMGMQGILERGCAAGVFAATSPKLTAYAILGVGVAVSNWYKPNGECTEDEVVHYYAGLALRMADVQPRRD